MPDTLSLAKIGLGLQLTRQGWPSVLQTQTPHTSEIMGLVAISEPMGVGEPFTCAQDFQKVISIILNGMSDVVGAELLNQLKEISKRDDNFSEHVVSRYLSVLRIFHPLMYVWLASLSTTLILRWGKPTTTKPPAPIKYDETYSWGEVAQAKLIEREV